MSATVASFNKTAFTAGVTNINITKPTGLAVGDTMIAVVSGHDTGAFTFTTPSYWTLVQSIQTAGTALNTNIFLKVADSSDVAASQFNFAASANLTQFGGTLMRISGAIASPLDTSEKDELGAASATITFTGSSVAANQDELILMVMVGMQTDSGVVTLSGYNSTPSLTWTEVTEDSVNSGTTDPVYGIAYANVTSGITFTQYGATLSSSKQEHGGALILIKSVVNATGTNTLLEVSPLLSTQNGVGGTTGTNALLVVEPQIFTQNGKVTNSTQWTNLDKPTVSNVNNLEKP